jgi:biopolymer transport protein TolQ
VTAEMPLWHMVMNASLIVQVILLFLLGISFISWTLIFRKSALLKRTRRAADDFEDRFWSGGELNALYTQIGRRQQPSGLEQIFQAGFREFVRLRQKPSISPMAIIEGAHRAMRVVLAREVDKLETYLTFLATVGSTSPYIGLFGTVWGIMNAFRALGTVQQASLSMVAPGIVEALIATAMGLFAAIPAVIAYNRYASDVERLINRYDTFLEEFSTVLQHQAHTE